MKDIVIGSVVSIYGNNINTDDIIPAWTLHESIDRSFFKKYAFSNFDKQFVKRCKKKNNVIVAGKNFGCGSSREQAIYALQENNVVAVIAQSFSSIFYRNALNNGLVLIVVDNLHAFSKNNEIVIDLVNKLITTHTKKVAFDMTDHEQKIFIAGGRLAKIQLDLTDELTGKTRIVVDYTKSKYTTTTPQTAVEKIVSAHVERAVFAGDKIYQLPTDILFLNEIMGPHVINEFLLHFGPIYKSLKKKTRVFNPKRVFFIPDHSVPAASVAIAERITILKKFSKSQGILCYKEGDGIEHVILAEDGYIAPGQIVLGADSHTSTSGALNTLAFGIGSSDASYTLATGHLYDFEVPGTVRVNLKGRLAKGVYAKDLVLHLIGLLGVDGVNKKIVEFGGTGLVYLSIEERMTIANMSVEMGARSGIFEYDKRTSEYLNGRSQVPYQPYNPDKGCTYEKIINLNLRQLEPCVALPHKPDNVTFISKINSYMSKKRKDPDFVKITTLKITDAFLGACTNGYYEDFVIAAKILKNRKVSPHVNFVAIPASRKIYNRLLKDGILEILATAGVNIESSNCGPCFGKHMGVLGKSAQTISSSNRNFIGRMGSKESKIFLASPATVTASAIRGVITDPRKFI